MVSVANIPWLGSAFDGFMVGLLNQGRLYRFTTYNGSRIDELSITANMLKAGFRKGPLCLRVEAHRSRAASLAAPKAGAMEGRIAESMTSEIHVKLFRRDQAREEVIFEGNGRNAGLEIAGEIGKFKRI